MPDQSLKPKNAPPALAIASPERKQRNRMLLAVLLLLVAVSLVVFKDRNSAFSEDDTRSAAAIHGRSQAAEPPAPSQVPVADQALNARPEPASQPASIPSEVRSAAGTPISNAVPAHRHTRLQSREKRASTASEPPTGIAASGPVVTATRTVLPPLRIEVVAGDRHSMVRPGSPSMKVDLQPESAARPDGGAAPSASEPTSSEPTRQDSASLTDPEHVQISTDTTQVLTHKVRPEYPLLARQMKVQGSVVLDAMIGKDGGIQNLQVVQGPTILADAAREAVRQWRFKPHLQDGQAVETQAHITVNFMISTN